MAKQYRIAAVGCGGAGTQHAIGYSILEDVEIVGLCDIDEAKAHALAEKVGGRPFSDCQKMYDELEPDIVSVCTREYDHAEPTIAALQSGSHVLCEKIFAPNLDTAKKMVRQAEESGKKLGIDYNYRHIPSVAWLKRAIMSGRMGKPVLMNAFVHSYCMHHTLDLCRYLLGEVVEVTAMFHEDRKTLLYPWYEQDEILYAPTTNEGVCLRFANGSLAVVSATLHRGLDIMMDIHLVGTEARASLTKMSMENMLGEMETFPTFENEDLTFPDVTERDFMKSFGWSIKAFVESLRAGLEPPTSGEDGVAMIKLEMAIVQSQHHGHCIRL